MTLEIGGKNWAQWNWMDRLGTGPVPTLVNEMLAFFAAVNPNHPGHELSMPVLPTRGDPAVDIGFRIRINHPIEAWSVLMTTRLENPPLQHTHRDKLSLTWDTGFDAAYRPNGSGLPYGDFHHNSSGRWMAQVGMPYIDYAGVGGTILMFRETTPGQEVILFWLANHGEPVASNENYAPQCFSLAWQESINGWLFTATSYRNLRLAGSNQSGFTLLAASLYPNGSIEAGLRYGNPGTADTLWTNPYLIPPSLSDSNSRGMLVAGGEGARFYYPSCMVAGYFLLATTADQPFDGNRLNFPGFPTLYQLGTWSTTNVTWPTANQNFYDDFLFFYLPEGHGVPDGWLPADEAFPWRAPVVVNARLAETPRTNLRQVGFFTPDGVTNWWPQLNHLAQLDGHPFYERYAPHLIGGGGGGSNRPGAGVLWPRRG